MDSFQTPPVTPSRSRGGNKSRTPRGTPSSNGLGPVLPNPCIVLKNLDYKISQHELEEVVRRVAGGRKEFVNLSLIDDKATGQFRGMAFVNFHTTEDASNALNALGKMKINERKVIAEFRRLRPGEKILNQNHHTPIKQHGRATFEKEVKINGVDEVDKRKNFFHVRDAIKNDKISKEKCEKLQRDMERENLFRKRLLEYHSNEDDMEDLKFENDLTSYERRMVHVICDEIGLGHMSVLGDDGLRVLIVTKIPEKIKKWAELTADIRKAANERKDEEKRRRKEEKEAAKLAAMNVFSGNKKADKEQLDGIKWFKPRSAKVADGDHVKESETIKVPQYKVYIPPRQPSGPDGTIGFQSRKCGGQEKELTIDGASQDESEAVDSVERKKSSGFGQTPLNPSVQPFTPSAAYAT